MFNLLLAPSTRLWLLSLLLLSVATDALAQSAPANVVTPAPPPREGTVGPEQLRDFSLPGTRTAPPPAAEPAATPAPARERVQPSPTPPQPEPVAASRSVAAANPDLRNGNAPEERALSRPAAKGTAPAETRLPAEQIAVDLGPPTLVPTLPAQANPPLSGPVSDGRLSVSSLFGSGWAWLAVAALLGIALAILFRQRARHDRLVPAGAESQVPPPPSSPVPAPAPPRPLLRAPPDPPTAAEPTLPAGLVTTRLRTAPLPSATAEPALPVGLVSTRLRAFAPAPVPDPLPSGGIVSTRFRPWIEVDVEVTEVVLTETDALLRYRLRLGNTGSAAARDLVIEALALNAGDSQAAELASFFERPEGKEVAIAEIARLGSTELTHEVRMPRAAIRAYDVQGRCVFVPIMAFNVSYRWGGGNGRSGAAFLLGHRQPGSERLAPLGLDEGARRLGSLGARRLENAVRR